MPDLTADRFEISRWDEISLLAVNDRIDRISEEITMLQVTVTPGAFTSESAPKSGSAA
jgi:hypothetical protein